jgi:hypothetical protein
MITSNVKNQAQIIQIIPAGSNFFAGVEWLKDVQDATPASCCIHRSIKKSQNITRQTHIYAEFRLGVGGRDSIVQLGETISC